MISYLDGIVDIPSIDVAGAALPVDVAEQHGLVAQGEAVEGQALEDILPGMAVHLVQGEAQVPYVLANDVQTIVISGGSRSSNLQSKHGGLSRTKWSMPYLFHSGHKAEGDVDDYRVLLL